MNRDSDNASTANGTPEPSKYWRYAKWGFKCLLIFAVAYLLLVPFIQPLLVRLYANLPFFLIAAGGLIGGIIIGTKNSKDGQKRLVPWTVLIVSVLALGGFAWCTNNVSDLVEWQMASSLDAEEIESMPVSNNNRLVPRPIALEQIKRKNIDGRTKAIDPHLVQAVEDGQSQMYWVAPMPYTVWYGKMFGSVEKVIRINAKTMQPDLESGKDAYFLFGHESMTSKILFRLMHPFSKEAEVVYWRKPDGSWVYLKSYTSYRMTWTLTMVPTMNGVMEFGPYGGFKSYSVKEAAEQFKGASLFPLELGEKYARAYSKFHRGLKNYWWYPQEDIFEISEDKATSTDENRAPYLQDFRDIGFQQVVALEPSGTSSFALREILYFDALTGKLKKFVSRESVPPSGPRQAVHDVVNADWDSPWQNYLVVEPLQVSDSDQKKLHWLVFVIKNDKVKGASVRWVLVDANRSDTKNAKKFDTVEELLAHIESLRNVKP